MSEEQAIELLRRFANDFRRSSFRREVEAIDFLLNRTAPEPEAVRGSDLVTDHDRGYAEGYSDARPVTQQEIVSAINSHACELARLTATWPAAAPSSIDAADMTSLQQQASSWEAVVARLMKHTNRRLFQGEGSGEELVLRELDRIYRLASTPSSAP